MPKIYFGSIIDFLFGHMNVNYTCPRDLVSCKNLYIKSYTRLLLLFAKHLHYQLPRPLDVLFLHAVQDIVFTKVS